MVSGFGDTDFLVGIQTFLPDLSTHKYLIPEFVLELPTTEHLARDDVAAAENC